ncbi:MAG: lysophospholipid acyltransferase family protein [Bacteroidetes bacterium]|nr:lysophospholipid acyltransferase family protein [Bacteroidota bacterium]
MKLKKARQYSLRFIGKMFLTNIVTALCKSLKTIKINDETIKKLDDENNNYILAFWHGTMLLPWNLHGNPNFVALISKSKDGDLLAKILKHWNYNVVRGSSSSDGYMALAIMIDFTKNSYSIAITPDGPRGPAHKFKAGAVITAKKSNVPLILAGVGYQKKKVLSNWDKFEVPYFFSKAKIIYSEPIFIEANLSYEETSNIIINCQNKLNELQSEAQDFR